MVTGTERAWDNDAAEALSRLVKAGFSPVASLPPQLVPVLQLDPFGPGLYRQRSSNHRCPHLLLTSWAATPQQIATTLVALGALANVRSGAPEAPLARPPWHLQGRITAAGTASQASLAWLRQLSQDDLLVTTVLGTESHTAEIAARAAALQAMQPDAHLFPTLCQPLPDGPRESPTSYVGAALDDDAQPHPDDSCTWLHTSTLGSLTAGIIPTAIFTVIAPWILRHARCATSQPEPRPRHRAALPAAPMSTSAHPKPPTPAPPQARVRVAPQADPASMTTTILQLSAQLWARRRALTALQLAQHGIAPGPRPRGLARGPAPRRGPDPPGHAKATLPSDPSPPPAPAAPGPARRTQHTLPVRALAPASPPHAPPAERVLRPGRDPDPASLPRHHGLATT